MVRQYEQREQYAIVCVECGKPDIIPFKPRGGEVCRECYDKKNGKSRGSKTDELLQAIHDELRYFNESFAAWAAVDGRQGAK